MKKNIAITLVLLTVALLVPATQGAENAVITADIASYNPVPLRPGSIAEVYVSVQNIGSDSARDVTVTFEDTDPFQLVQQSQRERTIQVLGAQKDYLLKYDVRVASDALSGQQDISLKIGYGDTELERDLPLTVRSQKALIDVQSFGTNPDVLAPGQEGDLSITVDNLAENALRNIEIELLEDEAENPLITVGQGNIVSDDTLPAGSTEVYRFNVVPRPEAVSKLYAVPFSVSYEEPGGDTVSKKYTAALKVNTEAELLTTIDETTITEDTMRGTVTVMLTNAGVSDVKLVTATFQDSNSFTVAGQKTRYIGDIESDDFDVIELQGTAENNTFTIPVELTYRNALNEERSMTTQMTYQAQPGTTGSNTGLIIIALIIIAAIGIYWYRKKR